MDERSQSLSSDVPLRSEFDVTHELAGSLQQAVWIGYLGAMKEPDIDVRFEGIDVGECRIADTRRRMVIM